MKKFHPSFDVRAMSVFIQVARDRSLTLASSRLAMTPSAVSKMIGRLEEDVGVRLLNRNYRSVTLTPAGERFFEHGVAIMMSIERAHEAAVDPVAIPRGHLKVSLPINFGRSLIAPRLPGFAQRYPEIDTEYLLVAGQLDPIEHNIDVEVWIGGRAWIDSRLVIRTLCSFSTLLCAAPAYLARYGDPKSIADLRNHQLLGGSDEKTGHVQPWRFRDGEHIVEYSPRLAVNSNAIDLLIDMSIAGAGIVYVTDYMVEDAVRAGTLRPILVEHPMEDIDVQIVCPRSRVTSPSVMAFVALVTEIVEAQQARMRRYSLKT